jgi:hypothetical protein
MEQRLHSKKCHTTQQNDQCVKCIGKIVQNFLMCIDIMISSKQASSDIISLSVNLSSTLNSRRNVLQNFGLLDLSSSLISWTLEFSRGTRANYPSAWCDGLVPLCPVFILSGMDYDEQFHTRCIMNCRNVPWSPWWTCGLCTGRFKIFCVPGGTLVNTKLFEVSLSLSDWTRT